MDGHMGIPTNAIPTKKGWNFFISHPLVIFLAPTGALGRDNVRLSVTVIVCFKLSIFINLGCWHQADFKQTSWLHQDDFRMTLGSLQDDSDSERTQRAFREKKSNQTLSYHQSEPKIFHLVRFRIPIVTERLRRKDLYKQPSLHNLGSVWRIHPPFPTL